MSSVPQSRAYAAAQHFGHFISFKLRSICVFDIAMSWLLRWQWQSVLKVKFDKCCSASRAAPLIRVRSER